MKQKKKFIRNSVDLKIQVFDLNLPFLSFSLIVEIKKRNFSVFPEIQLLSFTITHGRRLVNCKCAAASAQFAAVAHNSMEGKREFREATTIARLERS